jgi:hypothetical protein
MSPLEHQDLVFLFFAYSALFLAMFVFLYRMFQRTGQLTREVQLLREEYGEEPDGPSHASKPGVNL